MAEVSAWPSGMLSLSGFGRHQQFVHLHADDEADQASWRRDQPDFVHGVAKVGLGPSRSAVGRGEAVGHGAHPASILVGEGDAELADLRGIDERQFDPGLAAVNGLGDKPRAGGAVGGPDGRADLPLSRRLLSFLSLIHI